MGDDDPTSRASPVPDRVAVIVPAAGAGTRMGGLPKQFRLLGGAPVLVRTLEAFAAHPAIDALVVPVPAAEQRAAEAMLSAYGLAAHVVVGGATRQASVGEGLKAVPEGTGIVLVHDAARPFVVADRIAAVVAAVRAHGAAALAVPVADTLRRGRGETFGETVSREGLYAMQTPQGARLDWLRAAHAAAEADGITGTDEVELLQRAGYPVQVVEGDPRNLKLTRPTDWALAEALWERRAQREG
ncbi:MAG TPA: 2-C-methyl-D-erythritol 4-phosphate cytidylyltransferase [Rubricoccaceae bacterium]|nr:2-C-methyl-D-erythritol 4-phosphate cytidylyltransferase [Rubricoccaceae bacterium]